MESQESNTALNTGFKIETRTDTVESNPQASLYRAFAKAQGEFLPVLKNREAHYGKYADLTSVLNSVRRALSKNGLCVWQTVMAEDNTVSVETIVAHEDGAMISSGILSMPVTKASSMTPIQSFGSAETYARRYSLCAFLGISADDDDDGNGGDPMQKRDDRPAPKTYTQSDASKWTESARAAASRGTSEYAAWFSATNKNPQSRSWLSDFVASGAHTEMKAIAAEVTKNAFPSEEEA